MNYELRYAAHPSDAKQYDTTRLRKEFLIETIFTPDDTNMVYSMYDRYIVGGIMPVSKSLKLETVDDLKADFFLQRRELGIINVGGYAKIKVDGTVFELGYKEMLYIGRGKEEVIFESVDAAKPAKLYFNSAPAHAEYPCKKVTKENADILVLGSLEGSNHRQINRMIINSVVETCQLQMGMTELQPGSVWNTMPAHVHNRRMEAYFYFEVPKNTPSATSWASPTRRATSGCTTSRPSCRRRGASTPQPERPTTLSSGVWPAKTSTTVTRTSRRIPNLNN